MNLAETHEVSLMVGGHIELIPLRDEKTLGEVIACRQSQRDCPFICSHTRSHTQDNSITQDVVKRLDKTTKPLENMAKRHSACLDDMASM